MSNYTIIYVAKVKSSPSSGIWIKVLSQGRGLAANGCQVFIVHLTDVGLGLTRVKQGVVELLEERPLVRNKFFIINKFLEQLRLIEFSKEICQKISPNSVYFRSMPGIYFIINFLHWLKKRNILIFWEMPTYPYKKELLASRNYMVYVLDIIFSKKILAHVDYCLPITDRLPVELMKKTKVLSMSNGINVDLFASKKIISTTKKHELNLIGVANYQFWHGYDRLVVGLKNYYRNKQSYRVIFHIVGDGPALEKLKCEVKKLKMETYIKFYGMMSGIELSQMFDMADLGVASLAIHRNGLFKVSALKTKEFFARGIPYIAACEDMDVPIDYPYQKIFAADDTPIDIEQVVAFWEALPPPEVYISQMREYAKEYMDWNVKLRMVAELVKYGKNFKSP